MSPSYSEFVTNSRRSPVFSTEGIVACSQPLASAIGLSILQSGGNAADACVAMAAALNVTEPCNTGIGGDVFALFYDAKTKRVRAINGSGRSPRALTLDKVRASGEQGSFLPPTNINSVTVPGAAAAWCDIVKSFGSGKKSLAELLKPAIELAEKGFAVGPQAASEWKLSENLLSTASPAGAKVFLIDGKAPEAGQIFSNPHLANTFKLLGEQGRDGFYKGPTAQAIFDVIQSLGGHMTMEDLASHESSLVDPISYTYGGPDVNLTIHECPPQGQGLAALIALGILDALTEEGKIDLNKIEEGSAEWFHALIEAIRLAFADVHAYVGDPAFTDVPVDKLLSKDYLRSRAKLFSPTKAEAIYSQGRPIPSSDTVYFTATDPQGNAMSMINSNFLGFGTGVAPVGCGFTLQNRGGGFYLGEDGPNRLEGGKRPYHTIIPAMVTKGDELFMSYGVMGGRMQPQGHVQVLLNLLHLHHNPQSALDAPRFCVGGSHSAGLDGVGAQAFFNGLVSLEEGISPEVVKRLEEMGHQVEVVKGQGRFLFGKGQVVLKTTDERTGRRVYAGGSDPRGDGVALPLL